MNNYKVLIMNYRQLVKEFEIHDIDEETANHIAESYVNNYFNNNYQVLVLKIKELNKC